MHSVRFPRLAVVLLAACVAGAPPALSASEIELTSPQTPWRAYLVQGMNLTRDGQTLYIADNARRPSAFDPARFDPARHRFSPLPPQSWRDAGFDDHCWARYIEDDLADYLGDYGAAVHEKTWPTLLCLRTSFGIADPAQAADLAFRMTCIGGAVVYVNGHEVGRAYLPKGEMAAFTPADDYPSEAYTAEDGSPLPTLQWGGKRESKGKPEQQLLSRYEKRLRKVELPIPASVLVKGRNTIAVELHRSAVAGKLEGNRGWSHLGITQLKLTSAGGKGAIAYADAARGTHLWNADTVEQIADTYPQSSLVKKSWFHALLWTRGMPLRGIQMGNPFDELRPVRVSAPRNGVCSGQIIVSDLAGVKDLSASISDFKSSGGATIPASSVQIRFAHQQANFHYCDALMPSPPARATTVPVWLILQAPKDAAPGWYASTISIRANGVQSSVPVQVLVTGLTLPEARDLTPLVGMTHCPEAVAATYNVEPWSDRHFALMERSLALMGQVGNDVVHVPVIIGTFQPAVRNWLSGGKPGEQRIPLVRWVKTDAGPRPDFSLLNRYLDHYLKHCAPPKALCLYVWDSSCAREVADAYENRRVASRESTPKNKLRVLLVDPKTNESSEMEVPAIGDEGGEAFWKPLFDGARELVQKRGWSDRILMAGLGGDLRPGEKTGTALKRMAPYVRWNLLSHFSGDPAPVDGKMIATGGLEIGLKEFPWSVAGGAATSAWLERQVANPPEFLEIHTARWHHQEVSPPLLFRTLPLLSGAVSRLGVDFWTAGSGGPKNTSFFVHVNALAVPGPDGAIPTVRFQMLREGVQDADVRFAMIRAYSKLPAEQRKPYPALLDEMPRRIAYCANYLSQHELSLDWPGYVARVQQAAGELAGARTESTWESPPTAGSEGR